MMRIECKAKPAKRSSIFEKKHFPQTDAYELNFNTLMQSGSQICATCLPI